MSKFKVGDKVRCVKKPQEHTYQCKVGYEFEVERLKIIGNTAYIYPNFKYNRCFRSELFELVPKVLDINLIYKEL